MAENPTVVLQVAGSFITRDSRGEILETVDVDASGNPDWDSAGICDERGSGSVAGFAALVSAMDSAETVATDCGYEIRRVLG